MKDLQERIDDATVLRKDFEANYKPRTIAELVRECAETYGATVALDFFERGQQLTYKDLDIGSDRYANMLHTVGVRKGDRIGVMLPNRPEWPLIWFACAKLGAIIVPINMRYTSREIEFVMSDTEAAFSVVDESVHSVFSSMEPWPRALSSEKVLVVGDRQIPGATMLSALLEAASDAPIDEEILPDDLINIQYTSGTTGFPKGCMLAQDSWVLIAAIQNFRLREPYKRHLCWAPFFYADGQMNILAAMYSGATLYVAEKLSSSRFVDWLGRYDIEWVSFPEMIARQAPTSADSQVRLKQVHMGGAWQKSSNEAFYARFGEIPGHGFFGMTETGYGTIMPNNTPEMVKEGSCGMIAPFRELRLVREDGTPAPIGEPGELWMKGRGIMRGYWNRPEANAELFEEDWFKTGDLMRRDEYGFYWFVGRNKDMIRRSSENIAARELESVFREIPEIADVAAVPVPDANRGEEVKIWVELKRGVTQEQVPVERLVAHAKARLASFKVPRYIRFIDELPRLNTSLKIIKRELTGVANPLEETFDTEQGRWF